MKEGDGNESVREKKERKAYENMVGETEGWQKGVAAEDVYDRDACRRTSTPHKRGNKMKTKKSVTLYITMPTF